MAQLPAYAVDGGRVPAAMARRATYAATSGANGIIAIDDFEVTPLPTPGAGVQVQRGGALARQRLTGASQFETYVIAQDSAHNLDVPATSSAARTEYVIARVLDHHFTGGEAPANPADALYWEIARVASLDGITYPHVPLARLRLPAGTSAVTTGMIDDLREVAIPRRERTTHLTYAPETRHDLTGDSGYVDYPNGTTAQVDVPEWAGHAIIRADLLETLLVNANSDGDMVLMLGWQPAYTGARRFDEVWGGNTARNDHTVVAEFKIPKNYRGTTQPLRIRARKSKTSGAGFLRADAYTQVVYDVEFIEKV